MFAGVGDQGIREFGVQASECSISGLQGSVLQKLSVLACGLQRYYDHFLLPCLYKNLDRPWPRNPGYPTEIGTPVEAPLRRTAVFAGSLFVWVSIAKCNV